MKAREIKAVLRRLEWTQTEAAARLGVTQGAVSRWLSGDRPIPEPIVKLLHLLQRETRA